LSALGTAALASVAGFALGGSLIVAIGAQNAFVLQQGIRRQQVGVIVALCIVIDATLMSAGVAGLGAALALHPLASRALAAFGAAFLFWYGLQAARRALSSHALSTPNEDISLSRGQAARQTLAISLLNPHVYLDTVVLVGALGAQQSDAARPWFLAGAVSASAVWFTSLGYGARLLAPLFARPVAWRVLDALVALTMWLLAAMLLKTVFA
jgi:L-lysine exporter family protein LysE/ArgO